MDKADQQLELTLHLLGEFEGRELAYRVSDILSEFYEGGVAAEAVPERITDVLRNHVKKTIAKYSSLMSEDGANSFASTVVSSFEREFKRLLKHNATSQIRNSRATKQLEKVLSTS